MDYVLSCTKCGARYKGQSHAFRCSKCNSILEVKYNYSSMKLPPNFRKQKISHKKYLPFFPVGKKLVTLNEGGTRLAPANELAKGTDSKILLKVETTNPTRSFKDRGSSIEVSKAVEYGFEDIYCASTGNMGLSLATYANKQGISCTVFMGKGSNANKMRMIKQEGADIIKVDGDFNSAILKAEHFSRDKEAFLCGDYHYRKEGQKSVAFELAEQFGDIDYLFVQVGNATLLAGMHKGFNELKRFGLLKKIPKIIAVQSSRCSPLVNAYVSKKKLHHVTPHTYADAIAVGFPIFGSDALNAIRATHGMALAVSESEIKSARNTLASKSGISSEPGGAVSVAGMIKLLDSSPSTFAGKTLCSIITGNNEPARR